MKKTVLVLAAISILEGVCLIYTLNKSVALQVQVLEAYDNHAKPRVFEASNLEKLKIKLGLKNLEGRINKLEDKR